MRCTSCGLPLSPSRTYSTCPRCGTPIGSGQKAPLEHQQAYWGNEHVVQAGAGTPRLNDPWAQNMQGHLYNTPDTPLPQMPEYLPGILQQTPQQPPQQLSQSGQMWFQGPLSHPGFSPGILPPVQANPPDYSHKTILGFTLAGLCVLTGGLILVFVYFLAIGLPKHSSNNTGTTNSITSVSTPTTAPTATAIPSPTATIYPGQQYIDNAQMASAVDTNSLQPTQLTTTFKTNQKIYVAFQLHPAGHSGAVCLIWYLNGAQITHYSFAVGANSKLSYAYSIYGSAGSAYVEINWASTTQCTDQVLAQHVGFTVTG